jgi:hypothetical protein
MDLFVRFLRHKKILLSMRLPIIQRTMLVGNSEKYAIFFGFEMLI